MSFKLYLQNVTNSEGLPACRHIECAFLRTGGKLNTAKIISSLLQILALAGVVF